MYAAGLPIELSLNVNLIAVIFLAALGFYLYGYLETKNQWLSLLPSLLYVSHPYFLVVIFIRGAIAEAWFMGLLPWILTIFSLVRRDKLANWQLIWTPIILTVFFLSHQIMATLALIILTIWLLVEKQVRLDKKLSGSERKLLLSIGLTILLTAFAFIPMILERQFVRASLGQITGRPITEQLVGLSRLIFDKWRYSGLSGLASDQGEFAKTVGVTSWLVLGLAAWQFKKCRMQNEKCRIFIFWSLVFGLFVFMLTPYSAFVWNHLLILEFIQHPWRLLWVSILASVILLVELLKSKRLSLPAQAGNLEARVLVGAIVLSSIWALIFQAHPAGSTRKTAEDWQFYGGTGDSFDELVPISFNSQLNLKLDQQLVVRNQGQMIYPDLTKEEPNNDGQTKVISWTGTKMEYQVEATAAAEVIQRTAYFPGWFAQVDHQSVTINAQDHEFPGRIVIKVPAGKSLVQVKFGDSQVRGIGKTLSLMGVGGWAAVLTFMYLKSVIE